jgi:hypothetical protein
MNDKFGFDWIVKPNVISPGLDDGSIVEPNCWDVYRCGKFTCAHDMHNSGSCEDDSGKTFDCGVFQETCAGILV